MENKLPEDELPVQLLESISNEADEVTDEKASGRVAAYKYGYRDGYFIGATSYAPWKVKHDELKEKYDNILATESGHESKTENVWQSGYASGHEAGCEKSLKAQQGGWVKASDKPKELLTIYWCKVINPKSGVEFRRAVLITADGIWNTHLDVIEWLDETNPNAYQELKNENEKLKKQALDMSTSWYQLHTWQMKARDIIESLYDRFIGAAETADHDIDLKLLRKATAIFEDFGGVKAKTEYDSLKQENERLKEKGDKMEQALKSICGHEGSIIPPKHEMIAIAREALNQPANGQKKEGEADDLGTCKECGTRKATTDYNGHQYYVCDPCSNRLNREFDNEYK
jgi:hypothetical protein